MQNRQAKPAPTAQDILKTGLLNQWYMVCRASEVSDKPIKLKRLNQDIALWRDASGRVQAVEDFCPHRGAPLSRGRVIDGKLACIYHGLAVDGTGTVTDVPPVANCPLVGRKMIQGYPVREVADAIFLYFSDGLSDDVPELQLPYQLVSPEWSGFIYAAEWSCNYMLPLDNRLDPMHAVYLHADTFTLQYGVKQSKIEIHDTAEGFYIERDNQKGVNIDRTEVTYRPGSNFWVFTQIPYPKAAGGGFFAILSHLTPIDEDHTYMWVMRYQKSEGWRRDLWRFLYKNRLERRHDYVIEQDRDIIEAIPASARGRETMIQCDVGVSRIRRMLMKEATQQAERLVGSIGVQAAE
ncbi:aromatic ring-hydroxylating dioxygenase subunit alpha [Roseiarcaceae bacterium H3SJ34-1]|uniref:Rieske 2Fe-2S domain-containing protein n=1 Tax=Terripilifer ovatus TaxID=3032367 RepID=UPI003AB93F0B|nr:aromatic ring-hydroxylating dioxygenase subunit alpha [Roseiarcaceae bacterium H3SJ34-1]